jgi:hypothetical protein
VSIKSQLGGKSGIAHSTPDADALVYWQVCTQPLLASKHFVTDPAGRHAQVQVKVIIAAGFIGKRFLTHAANEAPVNFVYLGRCGRRW